jgi:Asp-tRNA(Asn)/Glu-tRNA(Gln) amidotransferase A subunit family amidase
VATTRDDTLHAWESIESERLLAQATELDALGSDARAALPLYGLLVGVKDNFDTADLPTRYGSPIYAAHRPTADAEVIRRLRAAGALIAGKTKMTEFAWMHATDTLNPIAPGRTPGGSSSGSAAAVAAGHVPVATGTQTAGSVNRPASYCGIVGYKASFGLIPIDGVKALSPSLDTVGLFGRSVATVRRVAGTLAGRPIPVDDPDRPLRLAFARTPLWDQIAPEAQMGLERAVAKIASGLDIGDVPELELAADFRDLAASQTLIQSYEAGRALAPELRDHPRLLSHELRDALESAIVCPPRDYETALRVRSERGPALVSQLRGYDGVLTPSTVGPPDPGLSFTGDPLLCRVWTLIGAPSISVPLAWTDSGLPVGLQVVGAPGSDDRLLAAAARIVESGSRPPESAP